MAPWSRTTRAHPTSRPRQLRDLEILEDRTTPVRAFALSNNALMAFDTRAPGVTTTPAAITGLTAGDQLVGIDIRPQNGLIYGIGVSGGMAQLYAIGSKINPNTGSYLATAIGARIWVTGANFGVDFNPTVDRIRFVSDAGLDLRLNPNNGAIAGSDPAINPITGVDGAAYTNSSQNAAVTTLYTLDSVTNGLYIQNPPNAGTEMLVAPVTLGGAVLDFSGASGFDIAPTVTVTTNNAVASGTGFALLTVGGVTQLYSIDLTSGAATALGMFAGNRPVQGLALQATATPGGVPLVGVTSGPTQQLVRFNSLTPGTTSTPINITGLAAGETIVGIDIRPNTGQYFAVIINGAAGTGRLAFLDPQTGALSTTGLAANFAFVDAVGNPVPLANPALFGYGVDFNPTVDRIRVVNAAGQNFRLNPNNGLGVDGNGTGGAMGPAGIQMDGPINLAPGGGPFSVDGTAYTNTSSAAFNAAGQTAGFTTQYTISSATNAIYIQNPPNSGAQTLPIVVTLNGAVLDFDQVNGFEIQPGVSTTGANQPVRNGRALAVLTVGGVANLYSINLVSGEATLLGPAGSGLPLIGLAAAEVPAVGAIATGNGPGAFPDVRVFNEDGTFRMQLLPFQGFLGGVRVATGDVNGDLVADIIVGAGPGAGPNVVVFDGLSGALLNSFFAFDPAFTGGVFVAAEDGIIAVGAGGGAGGNVVLFTNLGRVITGSFLSFAPGYLGGVTVGLDVSTNSVIVGAALGPPNVETFDITTGQLKSSFFAFDPGFLGGIFVSGMNGSIAVGANGGIGGNVAVFLPNGTQQRFFTSGQTSTGGVRVGRTGPADLPFLTTGSGPGDPATVLEFAADGTQILNFNPYDPAFLGGVSVG
jgi:hypothetical protein